LGRPGWNLLLLASKGHRQGSPGGGNPAYGVGPGNRDTPPTPSPISPRRGRNKRARGIAPGTDRMMKKPRPERAPHASGPESCFALSGLGGYSFPSNPRADPASGVTPAWAFLFGPFEASEKRNIKKAQAHGIEEYTSFNALRLRFWLVISVFPGIVCIRRQWRMRRLLHGGGAKTAAGNSPVRPASTAWASERNAASSWVYAAGRLFCSLNQ